MRTKLLMTLSSVFMALIGLTFTFMPDKVLGAPAVGPLRSVLLLIQVCGAQYLGFAMLNWMVRGNLIGGIYSRPVVVGNLLHFAMVSLVLLRSIIGGQRSIGYAIGLLFYAIFAIWFGLALFRHPVKTRPESELTQHMSASQLGK